jgi:uracil DNA glycosylase
LFGNQAQTFAPYINKKFNHVFKVKHPAYYARVNSPMPSNVFKEVSRIIENKYGEPIKWYKENEVFQ